MNFRKTQFSTRFVAKWRYRKFGRALAVYHRAEEYHALLARHIDTPQGVHIEREAHIEFALSTKQIYRREASLRLLGHKKDEEPFLILRLFY